MPVDRAPAQERYAERRNQWLRNAENSLNAVRREVGASRYDLAAAAAADASNSLAKAWANHAEVLASEETS